MNLYSTDRSIAAKFFLLGCFFCILAISCGKKSPTDSDSNQWSAVNSGLENLFVRFLAVHPSNSDIIFSGTWGGLYKSTDGAQTWTRLDSGWTYSQISAIAFDALHPETMYVGTYGSGVFKSEDGGESWEGKKVGLVDPTIYSIATDPTHSDTLFIGCDGGINRSYNGADTLFYIFYYNRASLAVHPQNSQIVYAGGKFDNFYKSEDGGDSWSVGNNGINLNGPSARIQWVLINPIDPNILYVGSNVMGVYKSTNAAGLWTNVVKGFGGTRDVRVIGMSPSNTDCLYAATNNGVYRSTDAGQNWAQWNEGLTEVDVKALAVAPFTPHVVYAGTWGEGVFKRSSQ